MHSLPDQPEFTWSHSRHHLFEECPRAYYWRYYGSHGGWRYAVGADTQLAWRLKNLTTLHSVLGAAVHDEARRSATAVRERHPRPSVEEMSERVRAALRAACLSTDRMAFLRDPKAHPMLRSIYYGGRNDRAEIDAVSAKIEPCLRHLHDSALWDRLAALSPASIVLVEAHDALEWEGVRIFAGPDVAVVEDGCCEIVDWKSGRRREEEEAREQLAGYAWFLTRKLGLEFVNGGWTARAVYLHDGEEETYVITRLDLLRAEHRIRESVEQMRGFLADAPTNTPLAVSAFPLLHPAFRFRCARCSYLQLCEREMSLPFSTRTAPRKP